MIGFVLGLLPDLLQWAPHILGGLGGGAGLLGLVPNLRLYAMIALAVLLALSVIGLLWYRGEYEACAGGQSKAIAAAQKRADDLANELIIAQAAGFAVTEKKVITYVDRIRTVQAPDTACPADPRMRLGSHGVRDILGVPDAQRGAPSAVQGP